MEASTSGRRVGNKTLEEEKEEQAKNMAGFVGKLKIVPESIIGSNARTQAATPVARPNEYFAWDYTSFSQLELLKRHHADHFDTGQRSIQ